MHDTVSRLTKRDVIPEEVSGKGIIVTGGTTGIGRATSLLLAAHGAPHRVLTFGRNQRELDDAMADLGELDGEVHGMTADIATQEGVRRVFEEADQKLGRLDVLINNAALAANSIVDGSYGDWEYAVKTNLLGYMACAHEAVARMREQGAGHIVNVGSMSADVREKWSSIYVATKSGIQGFSAVLRKEVNELGIKVTLIEPGAVGTDMQPGKSEHATRAEKGEMLMAEDIAACVYYCLTQPRRCDVVEVSIRPHRQEI